MLRKQLKSLSSDPDVSQYPMSGLNRVNSLNPPSDYDDIKVAACYETDYRRKS
jgi:hypothetical protein